MEQTPSKLIPALIGGAFMGILSVMPVINAGNCLCFMWLIIGGIVAGRTYSKSLQPGVAFKTGDAVIVGLLAGIYGGLFRTFFYYLLQRLGMSELGFLQQLLESSREISPEFEEVFNELQSDDGMSTIKAVSSLMVWICLGSIFSMAGGLLSVRFFKNKKPTRDDAVIL
ncbi:hypothetical protein JW948_09120 [bacterium]|nr:hypothetical protein [bacterium]